MKFIFSGDWHLSAYSQDPIIKGMPERLHYLMIVLNDMAKYAIDNGIDRSWGARWLWQLLTANSTSAPGSVYFMENLTAGDGKGSL